MTSAENCNGSGDLRNIDFTAEQVMIIRQYAVTIEQLLRR